MPIYDGNEIHYFVKDGRVDQSEIYQFAKGNEVCRVIFNEFANRSAHIPPSVCHRLETEFEWKNLSQMEIVVSPATNVLERSFISGIDVSNDHAYGRNTLYFAPGEYDPYSPNGLQVLEQRIGHLMTSASIGPPTRPRSNAFSEQPTRPRR